MPANINTYSAPRVAGTIQNMFTTLRDGTLIAVFRVVHRITMGDEKIIPQKDNSGITRSKTIVTAGMVDTKIR